jgi:predicted metalloprotease
MGTGDGNDDTGGGGDSTGGTIIVNGVLVVVVVVVVVMLVVGVMVVVVGGVLVVGEPKFGFRKQTSHKNVANLVLGCYKAADIKTTTHRFSSCSSVMSLSVPPSWSWSLLSSSFCCC